MTTAKTKALPGGVPASLSDGSLGFNYRYIVDYPENACRWLKAVLSRQEDIPTDFVAVVNSPNSVTPMLSADECESVLWWAQQIDGFDNKAEDDTYMSLIYYTDIDEFLQKSQEARKTILENHPWWIVYQELLPRAATNSGA